MLIYQHRCFRNKAEIIENFHCRQTCVLSEEAANPTPLLPNASAAAEIVPGFPSCHRSDNLTIVGDAKDALLLPDGGFEIGGVTLPTGQFCVERIKELNHVSKVFACSEHGTQK